MHIKPIESHKCQQNVFRTEAWKSLYNKGLFLFGIYNDKNELIGSFQLYRDSVCGLPFYKAPPFTPHNGLHFINQAQTTDSKNSFEKSVHRCLTEFIQNLNPAILAMPLPCDITDTQEYFWKDFKVIPNYTYRLNLKTKTEQALFEGLSIERQKSLRKAEKDEVKVVPSIDWTTIESLVLNTYARKGKKTDVMIIKNILHDFSKTGKVFAFLAFYNNTACATTVCVFDNNTAYYLLGGYDEKNKHQGAGVACLWNSILHAKKLGLEIFDFEGSMIPGVEQYFRDFGGDLVPYFTINKAWLPLEFLLKIIKRAVF